MGCNGSKSDGTESQSPPDNKPAEETPQSQQAENAEGGAQENQEGQESQGFFNSGTPGTLIHGFIDKHVSQETQEDAKEFVGSPKRVIMEKVSEKVGIGGDSDTSKPTEGPDVPSSEQIESTLSNVESTAESKVESATESVSESAGGLATSVSENANSGLEAIQETADKAKSQLSQAGDKLSDVGSQLKAGIFGDSSQSSNEAPAAE